MNNNDITTRSSIIVFRFETVVKYYRVIKFCNMKINKKK